jgi:hypothetical protein
MPSYIYSNVRAILQNSSLLAFNCLDAASVGIRATSGTRDLLENPKILAHVSGSGPSALRRWFPGENRFLLPDILLVSRFATFF